MAADGQVVNRWVPRGGEKALKKANYAVNAILPAIAERRRLNRGFEALAISPDERWLYLIFQSPLAHPDVAAFAHAVLACALQAQTILNRPRTLFTCKRSSARLDRGGIIVPACTSADSKDLNAT